MKKEVVTFVCDICEATLPEEYVKNNTLGNPYYAGFEYNTIRLGEGRSVTVCMDVEACGTKQHEFCPKCRVGILRDVLRKLESELEE